jgi:hypothetical protein
MKYLSLSAVALVVAFGCTRGNNSGATVSDTTAAAATAPANRAVTAARLANAIAANRAAADSILTAAGYTRDSFNALMYEIAADSAMSVAYAGAKNP